MRPFKVLFAVEVTLCASERLANDHRPHPAVRRRAETRDVVLVGRGAG